MSARHGCRLHPADWNAQCPTTTRCKHGDETCDRCGTSHERDAIHTTRGGVGRVGGLMRSNTHQGKKL